MVELTIPRLAGTRDALLALLEEHGVPGNLAGTNVVIICRDVVASSASYVDELVLQVLEVRAATELVLVSPSDQFRDRVVEAAERRGLTDRVRVTTAVGIPG